MSTRGIINGEIRDRTGLFTILGFVCLLFLTSALPLFSGFEMLSNAPSNRWYHRPGEHLETRGAIVFLAGLFIFFLLFFFISREFAFIRMSPEKIIIKRPLLVLFPFSKQKVNTELLMTQLGGLKIKTLYRGERWYFLDKNGNELVKLNFNGENNFTQLEWQDCLEKTGISLKISREYYRDK